MTGTAGIHGVLLASVCAIFPVAVRADEAQPIRALIGATFDRPEARVVSDPVVIEEDYAVADWVQGGKGGRALLRKQRGQWLIALCAGDSLRSAEGLARAGVPREVARNLSQRLAQAERAVPPAQLELFSRFKPAGDEVSAHHHGHH